MIKELKYTFYLLIIFLFVALSGKYYFSENHKKKSYRSHQILNVKIDKYARNTLLLKNNTNDIIEYVENNKNKIKKKYHFWNLLTNNEK